MDSRLDSVRASLEASMEYAGQLDRIKASYAYSRGASGAGENILIVDSGINAGHFEFSGSGKVTQSRLIPTSTYTPMGVDDWDHGSYVAAAAAGERDGVSFMHGVAYAANIHVAYLQLGSGGSPVHTPANLTSAATSFDSSFARYILDAASNANADVVNLSFGVSGAISTYDADAVRTAFRPWTQLMAQTSVKDADKKIFVWAAGNAGNDYTDPGMTMPAVADSPELIAGLGAYVPELRSHVLAVASVDADTGVISDFSNHCGIAESFCLAAPGAGEDYWLPYMGPPTMSCSDPDDCYIELPSGAGGTSFAAPVVSGALVLLRQYFRGQLGNTELVQRALATADKTGIYADSDIYGQGLLDLDRATWVLGTLSVALDAVVGGEGLAFAGTSLKTAGSAAGDSLARAFEGREIAAFDEMGAPFFYQMDALTGQTAAGKLERDDPSRLMAETAAARLAWGDDFLRLEARRDDKETRISRFSYHHATDSGSDYFLSLCGRPGYLFGPYRDESSSAPIFGDRLLYSPPYLNFSADGFGAGGSIRLPGASRLAYGFFRGGPAFSDWDRPAEGDNRNMMLELALPGDALIFQAGHLRESDGVAGLNPRGAMGQFSGRTAFGGLVVQSELGSKWTARAAAYLGKSKPHGRSRGIVRGMGSLTTSAFGMGVEGREILSSGDTLGISLDQPLRIERGSMSMRVPVGRTRYREVVHEAFGVDLEPSGRNMRLQASYARASGATEMRLEAGIERHAGHNSANGAGPYARLMWGRSF